MVLDDVDWRTYSRLVRVFADRPSLRLAYDRGKLEIMNPLPEHETGAYVLGRFVDTLTEEDAHEALAYLESLAADEDDEELTPEDWAQVKAAEERLARGEFIEWDFENELGRR